MRMNLKVFRIKKHLKQKDIAEKLGLTRSSYSMIEKGKRRGGYEFWSKLQNYYNIPDAEMWELMKDE